MTKEEMLKLAEYLRELENKLSLKEEWAVSWVQGSLIGLAEMLELRKE